MYILQQLTNFYATDNIMMVLLIAMTSAFAIGHLLNKILGGMSFGLAGNAILVMMSMVIAVSVGPETARFVNGDDTVRMIMLSSAVATGLMLALGALKAYLLQFRV
ncbi:MAG: hypothetical protein AB7F96_17900 [Beijerinckiaceae bacterium]